MSAQWQQTVGDREEWEAEHVDEIRPRTPDEADAALVKALAEKWPGLLSWPGKTGESK